MTKLVTILVSLVCAFFLLSWLHSFLAINRPVATDIMLVEGWISEKAVRNAVHVFYKNNYHKIISIGIKFDNDNVGEKGKHLLMKHGIPENSIVVLSPELIKKQSKTVIAAKALKDWIESQPRKIKAINICTEGVHAKKSFIIFKNILEPATHVGIVSLPPSDYNPHIWWLSPLGWKWVVYDFIKYLRAVIFNR